MTAQLGNRSSAFNAIYPTNTATGILQVENVSTVDNVLLASYRATADGPGYATGDIIFYRQIGTDSAQALQTKHLSSLFLQLVPNSIGHGIQ